MDIAMFTETFLPHSNGVTTSLLNARHGLKARGHKVTIYSAGPEVLNADDVHFYGGKIFHLYPDFPIALYPTRRSIRFNRRLRREGADLVHVHAPGPMGFRGYQASKRLKVPLVLTHHTLIEPLVRYAPFGWKTIYRAGSKYITWRLARKAKLLLAPSRSARAELEATFPDDAHKVRVVPTGIDTERFHPDIDTSAVREAWGYTSDERAVLYLGRLSYEKRVDVLLDAFAQLRDRVPNAHLVVAGSGPAAADLKSHARRLDLQDRVRFLGHVADAALPQTYAAADAFASASEVETQGLTLLEAMAVGKPVAVTAWGGYLDFVRDGENGFLFPRSDSEAAAKAIENALDASPQLRASARRTAERFSTDACIPLLERAYQEALDR